MAAVLLGLLLSTGATVSLDLKDAPVEQILRVLSEAGSLQVVLDPGIQCSLTLKVKALPLGTALGEVLRACSLAAEGENGVLRVAPIARLAEEAREEAALAAAREENARHELVTVHLSYARAAEIAPLLRRLMAPRGDVTFDPRTNVLLIRD
jgi:type IV pilus assembly protein PilQ